MSDDAPTPVFLHPSAIRLLWLLALVLLSVACSPSGDIRVTDAVMRPPLPGKTMGVAYFTLDNPGSAPLVLIGAESPIAGAIEMHTHIHDGDMMRMRRVDQVEIAPKGSVTFKTGGYHLMLFRVHDLKPPRVPITLLFKRHAPVTVAFELEDY